MSALLGLVHPDPNMPTALLISLLVVLGAASVGGFGVGVLTAVASAASITWFLTEPEHTFSIEGTADVVAVVTYLMVAVAVSALVAEVVRRSADAASPTSSMGSSTEASGTRSCVGAG